MSAIERAPAAWGRLGLSTRTVLLLMAGIDAAGGADMSAMALRDWREFASPEQTAIKRAAGVMLRIAKRASQIECAKTHSQS